MTKPPKQPTLLGVISDTHDALTNLDKALEFYSSKGVTTVIHCGDWKSVASATHCAIKSAELGITVHGVLGNNDVAVTDFLQYALQAPGNFQLQEGILELYIGKTHIGAYHGHHKPTLRKLLTDPTYDVVLLGHSHKPLITEQIGKLIVNPGSTAFAIPRSKTWKPSVAIIHLESLAATIHYLQWIN